MFEKLPMDPVLCLSVVNTKLRDYYRNLDLLCQDLGIEKNALVDKLKSIDYEYDEKRNQFVQEENSLNTMEKYIDEMDLTLEAPVEEPERQYYFIKKATI